MTRVVIFKKKDRISGFEISGHTGYAEEGSDIVCSAVSSVSQMALLGIKDVLKLNIFFEMSDGFLKLSLGKNVENESAQVLLKSMEKSLREIQREYGNYVKLEVKEDVF